MEINNEESELVLDINHVSYNLFYHYSNSYSLTQLFTNSIQHVSQPAVLTAKDFERIDAVRIAFDKRIELG